jgi:pimeloyl-ACP methyl ester carboxylesterase
LDLLGQGKSAKPGRANGIEYSISLWADLVDSYARENIQGDVVLAGNSLGSLVALSAATGDFATNDDSWLKNRVKGICMFNCGVGLNSRGIAKEPQWNPTQRFLIDSIYNVLTALIFNNRALLGYVLDKVVTRELLRDTLQTLYKRDPDRVDDELVESFYLPAKDEGSVEALSQIYCNDPGATPFELHDKYSNLLNDLPIHLVWGNDDVITPLEREGGVGKFYMDLAADEDTNVSFKVVESGHVPFDDNPTESNMELLKWLEEVVAKDATKAEAFGGLGWLVGR